MTKAGGWTDFHDLLTDDLDVFVEAMNGLVGVSYTPVAVATQVVAGVNYCFLCKAQAEYPDAKVYYAKVCVFKPLNGKAHIIEISRISPIGCGC